MLLIEVFYREFLYFTSSFHIEIVLCQLFESKFTIQGSGGKSLLREWTTHRLVGGTDFCRSEQTQRHVEQFRCWIFYPFRFSGKLRVTL